MASLLALKLDFIYLLEHNLISYWKKLEERFRTNFEENLWPNSV